MSNPGSTYTLFHDAERPALAGVYYQATQGQSYRIEFTPLPPE